MLGDLNVVPEEVFHDILTWLGDDVLVWCGLFFVHGKCTVQRPVAKLPSDVVWDIMWDIARKRAVQKTSPLTLHHIHCARVAMGLTTRRVALCVACGMATRATAFRDAVASLGGAPGRVCPTCSKNPKKPYTYMINTVTITRQIGNRQYRKYVQPHVGFVACPQRGHLRFAAQVEAALGLIETS